MSEPGAIRRMPRPGTIVPFGGDTIPSGWLLCNGAAVSRTAYARLYSAIGTAWGSGDGSTTFNLPDGRGRVLQGADSTNSLGVDIAAGLPELEGSFETRQTIANDYSTYYGSMFAMHGPFSSSTDESNVFATHFMGGVYTTAAQIISFTGSKSSSLYCESSVQQAAIASNYMIRC